MKRRSNTKRTSLNRNSRFFTKPIARHDQPFHKIQRHAQNIFQQKSNARKFYQMRPNKRKILKTRAIWIRKDDLVPQMKCNIVINALKA